MLRNLDQNLWVSEQPLKYMGLAVGARMTIIRLADGGLWVHSPLRLTAERRQAVEALGPVRFLVAPNKFHHLFIGEWMAAYPQARAYAAPGLPQKRKDLSFHAVLGDQAPAEWGEQIELQPWRGAPMLSETVFFHRPSRTLMVTDTVHNVGPDAGAFTSLVFKLFGGYGRLSTSLIERMVSRDRAAVRRTVDAVLQWDFQRVIMAHGHIVESNGAQAFREAYVWL